MDAVARAEALVAGGAATEDIVRDLRERGFNPIESMSAVIKAAGLSFSDAREAVIESPIWADHREKIVTRQRIDPPEPLDETTLVQLSAVCEQEPRILEAWLTGSRLTRADGSSTESTDIALVLDPPFDREQDEDELVAEREMLEKLGGALPPTRRRGWLYLTSEDIARETSGYVQIYPR